MENRNAWYIREIKRLLTECNDTGLLDLILKLLQRSED